MSGIFRSNSTTNHTNESTPNKRYSFSAFCTSPGTLQDVTMENPYGVGYRSPCVSLQPYHGSISPAVQGRSVREFEEQMASLRKENFNLKLRLYFIEESIPGYHQTSNSNDGQETLMKQLIDTKVELEILRKEVKEKQDLLKDAAHAMNQMENIQKETENKYQEMLQELKQKLSYYETKSGMEKSQSHGEIVDDLLGQSEVTENLNALQRISELEGLLRQTEEKLVDFQSQISTLDEILAKRDETIREYEDKVKELVFQNAELLESVETKEKEAANNERSIRGLRSANAQLKAEHENLSKALKITQDNFHKEITSAKACEKKLRDQEEVLSKMQVLQQFKDEIQKYKLEIADKACVILDLEEKLHNRNELYDKARYTIQQLMLTIKNKQTEINQLKNHNSSHSSNNQSNSQKEVTATGLSGLECTGFCRSLSDSETNRDLNTSQKQKYELIIERQESTIQSQRIEIKKKTADLQNLVNKELWEKNREIERLNKMLNNNKSPFNSPTSPTTDKSQDVGELQQSFSEVEFVKAVQRNKLLQRKVDILLQRLDSERNSDAVISQLRIELNKAREESETAEKWRRQCAEFCTTLSTRLEELAGFLNSLLKHKDILGFLAVEKRKAMRRAVDRSLDLSKSLNMTLSVSGLSMIDQSLAELTNLSGILGEFEGGLENQTFNSHEEIHDAGNQSLETLKAENKALKRELDKRRNAECKKERRSLPLSVMTENRESESEAWSEPDRKVSMARIGLEDHSGSRMVAKEQPAIQQTETDSDYSESVQLDSRSAKTRTQERINHLEQMIQQRDNRILEIQCQLVDSENRVKAETSKVSRITTELQELMQRNKELHDDLVAIGSPQDSQNAQNESLLLRQIAEKTQFLEKVQEERDRLMVESRLAEMQINSIKADMEDMKQRYEVSLTRAAEREKEQLSLVRQEMEEHFEKVLKAKEDEYQESLEHDWISKDLYEECKQQLSELQRQYIEAQRCVDCLQENERELKQTLIESEMATRNLQKEIDESTLRASKAAMERVKALNDKLQLEKRLEELTQDVTTYKAERTHLQQRVQHLENEHKCLMARLAEAETAKAAIQSGYTSEEVPMASSATAINAAAQLRMGEQRINNSSPDLGIESDAGRVSSAELSNIQRPLLKTVEINSEGEERSNIDGDNLDSSLENIKPSNLNNAATPKKHDCLKVEQENAELRRKLLRTKRAFEDTYEKLRNANQRKAQIEKDIKNQILKTHNVLKNPDLQEDIEVML